MDELTQLPLAQVNILLVNEIEAEALSGASEMKAMLKAFEAKWPDTALVLTLGSHGARVRQGAQTLFQPACPVYAVDTTAAGDTFTGYLLGCLAQGMALAVTRRGAAESIPTLRDVQAFRAEA